MRSIQNIFCFAPARKEHGVSLVEVMIALGILIAGGYASMVSISQIMATKDLAAQSTAAVEVDQMVRYESVRLLDRFQRIITEQVEDSSIRKMCKDPYRQFLSQVQWDFRLGQSFVFGRLDDLAGEKAIRKNDFGLDQVVKEAQRARSSNEGAKGIYQYVKANKRVTPSHKELAKAFKRCNKKQSITKDNPENLKDSFYICGHAKGVLVEIKAVFWDFVHDQSLQCSNMNGYGGRGIRAMYSVYHYSRDLVKGEPRFLVKNFDGRFHVAKSISNDFEENDAASH